MGKFAAIIAVFSLLFIQFVHAAVLDGEEMHASSTAAGFHAVHSHGHSEPVDHQDGQDDDRGLGSLHSLLHDSHQFVFFSGIPTLVVADFHNDFHLPDLHSETGLILTPPVPPPSL